MKIPNEVWWCFKDNVSVPLPPGCTPTPEYAKEVSAVKYLRADLTCGSCEYFKEETEFCGTEGIERFHYSLACMLYIEAGQ